MIIAVYCSFSMNLKQLYGTKLKDNVIIHDIVFRSTRKYNFKI